MTALNLGENFRKKLSEYLAHNNLTASFFESRVQVFTKLIKALDLTTHDDMCYLGFLMWTNKKEMMSVINSKSFPNLMDTLKSGVGKTPPSVNTRITGSLTPLGGIVGTFSDSVYAYNCLKFIGQFTKSQSVYAHCIAILESIPKVEGPILSPESILYLMNYNQNVDTSVNKHKKRPRQLVQNKKSYFDDSVFLPNPSFDDAYEREKRECVKVALKEGTKGIHAFVLADFFVSTLWRGILNTNEIRLPNEAKEGVAQALVRVSEHSLLMEKDKKRTEVKDVMAQVKDEMRFLDSRDKGDFMSIGYYAAAYITDGDGKDKEPLRYTLFMEIFEAKLFDKDSEVCHSMMRDAAKYGRIWMVQFLVDRGVATENLPTYGEYKWSENSVQIKEILEEPLSKCAKDHDLHRHQNRQVLLKYMLEHKLLN